MTEFLTGFGLGLLFTGLVWLTAWWIKRGMLL